MSNKRSLVTLRRAHLLCYSKLTSYEGLHSPQVFLNLHPKDAA
mgnify:CR=1 FL=1